MRGWSLSREEASKGRAAVGDGDGAGAGEKFVGGIDAEGGMNGGMNGGDTKSGDTNKSTIRPSILLPTKRQCSHKYNATQDSTRVKHLMRSLTQAKTSTSKLFNSFLNVFILCQNPPQFKGIISSSMCYIYFSYYACIHYCTFDSNGMNFSL